MEEKKKRPYPGYSEARKQANKRWNEKQADVKVRMSPEKKAEVQEHAASMEESTTAFINRAIDETMERDNKKKAKKKNEEDN